MTNEIGLAFSHPIERSVASGISVDDQDVDRISLRDHIVEVEIGAFEAERGTTQRICFNVVVEVRWNHQAQADDVDRILSYDKVTEAISHELAEAVSYRRRPLDHARRARPRMSGVRPIDAPRRFNQTSRKSAAVVRAG